MRENIIRFIDNNPYCTIGQLCGHYDGKKKDLMSLIDNLIQEGDIIKEDDCFLLPSHMGLFKAQIVSVKKTFAFASIDKDEEDVRINDIDMGNALLGDIVYLRYINGLFKVISVIKRRYSDIVGEVILLNGEYILSVNSLACDNINFIIKEPKGISVNDIVQAEIDRFEKLDCFVNIKKILGQKNEPFMDITRIILENDAPLNFPDQVNEEVLNVPTEVSEEEIKGRLDLRDEFVVTIDGEDSRDFDDAISLKFENDMYVLGVHIADVSHYVKPESFIDKEAFNRGTSIYICDRVVPMLPFSLSNGICSLNEGVDRLTLSCIIYVDRYGNILDSDIKESVIRSTHRLTYTYVNNVIKENNPTSLLEEKILLFNELALLLRQKKKERGSLEIDVPEIKIEVDEKGFPINIKKRVQQDGEKLIEDFMVLANEVVASTINKRNLPFIYRIHENPVSKRLANFVAFCSRFGVNADFSVLNPKPLDLQRHMSKFIGSEYKNVIGATLLRCLAKARYASSNKGHFGLASKCYTHFTSPIRRYPDLIVHRLVKKYIINNDNSNLSQTQIQLDFIAENTSIKERRAITIERDCNDMKGAEYMSQFIGQTFSGFINGFSNTGLYFELENGLSGCIRYEDMDDYYIVSETQYFIVGRRYHKKYSLGDKISAVLVKTDKYSGTSTFEMVTKSKTINRKTKKRYK